MGGWECRHAREAEPLRGGGRCPLGGRLPHAPGSRPDQEVPRAGRRRRLRRGGREVEAAPELPAMQVGRLLHGREDARRPRALGVRRLRPQVRLALRDRLRERQEGALEAGALHTPHVLQRAARRLRRALRHIAPDRLGVEAQGHGHHRRLPGPGRAEGQGPDRRDARDRLRPQGRARMEAEARPQQEQDMHRRRDRRPQERSRRPVRPRQAVREAHQGRAAVAHRGGCRDIPRHGEVAQVPPQGGQGRGQAVQGRHQGPGVPGAHGHGQQPVFLDQAIPEGMRWNGPQIPPVIPQLVRVPLQGQAGGGAVAESGEGPPPSGHG